MKRHALAFLNSILILQSLAAPATADAQSLPQLVEDYLAKRPTKALQPGLSLNDAYAAQQRFVERLEPKLGVRAGHKIGLVTPQTQERYGAKGPMRGVLLRAMMFKDGAEVPLNFGARPMFEADMIVVVKDDGIHSATTPLEVAQHLSEVVCFIELPDSLMDTTLTPDVGMIIAGNAGARAGVLGQRTAVKPTREFVEALGETQMTMTDQTGKELANAKAKVILGHPLNAVLWLIKDLSASGQKLKAGDLLSLGSIAPPQTPQAGQRITLRYEGLPGGPLTATVRFK